VPPSVVSRKGDPSPSGTLPAFLDPPLEPLSPQQKRATSRKIRPLVARRSGLCYFPFFRVSDHHFKWRYWQVWASLKVATSLAPFAFPWQDPSHLWCPNELAARVTVTPPPAACAHSFFHRTWRGHPLIVPCASVRSKRHDPCQTMRAMGEPPQGPPQSFPSFCIPLSFVTP